MLKNEPIIALATPNGIGAIAVIRLSGNEVINIVDNHFESVSGKQLKVQPSHSINLGYIKNDDNIIDQVLVSIFKNPQSYTGEDVVEISCHGSTYVQQAIIQLFLDNGVKMADPGEFTLRAFLNGKFDLSQAEAVADLIASDSSASHQLALQQMKGGFSTEIENLRKELVNFASLIELELDFSEEDVDFANRKDFKILIEKIKRVLRQLIDSFAQGNVLKNGIPIAIIGEPNVGKSTLLNALLKEEKAIVSHIPGTTRDAIEDDIILNGVRYRFIDTAGIRETSDYVESIGIQKTYEKSAAAKLIVYLFDTSIIKRTGKSKTEYLLGLVDKEFQKIKKRFSDKEIIMIGNKIDLLSDAELKAVTKKFKNALLISATDNKNIEKLIEKFANLVNIGILRDGQTIVSNSRHYDALSKAFTAIEQVQNGIENNLSSDLLSIDVKEALYHLGLITGAVTSDELLGNIFANFCIGK